MCSLLLSLCCVFLLSLPWSCSSQPTNTSPPEEALQCYVDAGALVVFPGNTSLQRQQDVLNSLLFAQLAAGTNYPRESDPEEWFSYFEYILRNIGWVLTSNKFDVAVRDDYFVLASLALNQMPKNDVWGDRVETFRRFFNTLHSLPNDDNSVQLFYESTFNTSSSASNLIVCSFSETPDNKVQLNLLTFSFSGLKEAAHRYLFHVYRAKDVVFSKADATSMTLNDEVFRKIEPVVKEKLGDRVKTMISQVKIV